MRVTLRSLVGGAPAAVLVALAALPCGGCERKPAPPAEQRPAAAGALQPVARPHGGGASGIVVARDVWVRAFEVVFPTSMCLPDAYSRHCFEVGEDECIRAMRVATKVCIEQLSEELPAALHQPADGRAWGTRIGSCAGRAYEISLAGQGKRIDSARCNDVRNWMP